MRSCKFDLKFISYFISFFADTETNVSHWLKIAIPPDIYKKV